MSIISFISRAKLIEWSGFFTTRSILEDQLLSLDHQTCITNACNDLAIPLSEYNFANLYLFRKVHQYSVIEISPSRYGIKGVSYDGKPFFMPLFHPLSWASCIRQAKNLHVDYLFPIPEQWTPELEREGFSVEYSENDSDYLYDAEAIRTYRGRHLDGQRNLVRNLRSEHSINVKELSDDTRAQAFHVIDAWREKNTTSHESDDAESCREAVMKASVLGLQGWIYEVDDVPAGLLVGGPLTSTIYIYHFSKASGYRGLSALMYQDAASRIDRQYTVLNWEQDMGLPGLRHSLRG